MASSNNLSNYYYFPQGPSIMMPHSSCHGEVPFTIQCPPGHCVLASQLHQLQHHHSLNHQQLPAPTPPQIHFTTQLPKLSAAAMDAIGRLQLMYTTEVLPDIDPPQLTRYDIPTPPPPYEQPQPNFFVTQPLPSNSALKKVPDMSLSPPIMPELKLKPTLTNRDQWKEGAQRDSNGDPYLYVNIPVPGIPNGSGKSEKGYLFSIPVPVSELLPAVISENNLTRSPEQRKRSCNVSPATSSTEVSSASVSETQQKPGQGQSQDFRRRQNPLGYNAAAGVDSQSYEQRLVQQQRQYGPSPSTATSSGRNWMEGYFSNKSYPPQSFCKLCVRSKETELYSTTHKLHDENGIVTCPVLRRVVCRICGETGDNAHTVRYCPLKSKREREEDSDSESDDNRGSQRRGFGSFADFKSSTGLEKFFPMAFPSRTHRKH